MGFLLSKNEGLILNISKVMAHYIIHYPSPPILHIKFGNFKSKGQFTSETVVLILTTGSLDPGLIPGRAVLQLR